MRSVGQAGEVVKKIVFNLWAKRLRYRARRGSGFSLRKLMTGETRRLAEEREGGVSGEYEASRPAG